MSRVAVEVRESVQSGSLALAEWPGSEQSILFFSQNAAFDYLWSNGSKVRTMIFEAVDDHLNELYDTAINWPEIRFIIAEEFSFKKGEPPTNVEFIGTGIGISYLLQSTGGSGVYAR